MTTFNWHTRHSPQPGESLASFLRRWGRDNHCGGRKGLLLSLGMPTKSVTDADDVKKLAIHLGVPPSLLQAVAPSSAPNPLAYRASLMRTRYEAVCPGCLQTDGSYSRQLWVHRMGTACPQHGRKLLDACTECGQLLEQERGDAAHCGSCGADLRRQHTDGASQVERAFNARLCGDDTATFPLVKGETPRDLDLFVLGLATYLCGREPEDAAPRSGPLYAARTLGKVRLLLDPFFTLLEAWPANFEGRISELLAANRELTSGPARAGGLWYRHVFKRHQHLGYTPTRKAVANAMVRNFDGNLNARVSHLLALATTQKGSYSVAEAALEIGVSASRIQSGIDAGLIEAAAINDSAPQYRQRFLARTEIDRLKAVRVSYIDHTQARALLGVSRKQYPLLLEAGCLTLSDTRSVPPVIDGPVLKQSVVDAVTSLQRLITPAPANDVIPFDQLNLRRTTDRQRLVALLADIFGGRVRPVGCDGREGVAGLLFDRHEVDRRIESRYVSRALTLQQVCLLLGVHEDAVRHWADAGLIATERASDAQGTPRMVQLQDLIEFLLQYSPLSVLAPGAQTSSRALGRRLALAGVSLACDSAARGALVKIEDLASGFLRNSVAARASGDSQT